MQEFIAWYQNQTKSVISNKLKEKNHELSKVEGVIEDVESKQEEIEDDLRDNTLLKDNAIRKTDLALKSIMKNGSRRHRP